jgi:hypothetical protein
MREIRTSGSEGGGAAKVPLPTPIIVMDSRFRGNDDKKSKRFDLSEPRSSGAHLRKSAGFRESAF